MLARFSTASKVLSPRSPEAAQVSSPGKRASGVASPRLKLSLDNQSSDKTDLIHAVLTQLDQLIRRMDEIKHAKLRSVRLGGELRGLLGKAEDELKAHADTFKKHETSAGLNIQLQNFQATLFAVVPIIDVIHAKKFLVNSFVKRNIQFAFQEISSYYSSLFTELSLAVARDSGSAAEAAVLAALSQNQQVPEEVEDYDAMYLTAHQYYFGHGKEKNVEQAFRLYLTAAKNKQVDAMVCVGCMYREGLATEKDQETALQWFHQAADSGSIDGTYYLGLLLMEKAALISHAQKQQEAYAQAHVHLVQSACRGFACAQFTLGNIYLNGTMGIPADTAKAQDLFKQASSSKHVPANVALGKMLMDQGEKSQAAYHFNQAIIHSKECTEPCIVEAMHHLGRLYLQGDGVPKDLKRGLSSLCQAANAGNTSAKEELAQIVLEENPNEALQLILDVNSPQAAFLRGCIFESPGFRSLQTALFHYTAAAEQGHVQAAMRAASLFYSGYSESKLAPNRAKAFHMYSVAAVANNSDALNALGLMHEEGIGCQLDLQQAAKCLKQAADLGNPYAHFNYGCLLRDGKGVEKDETQAHWHFRQAKQLGYPRSNP
ncbi:hypothetical protein AC1031_007861 [Aphanomyces cochlioides]|nr:hypothetical protein AC1031_007861 [Aphanomyces cochlioides]